MSEKKIKAFVYQIYYDDASFRMLDKGYCPLDNSSNERPDWFEFWVIRKFLLNTTLQEDAWYGFLSPKFGTKTGLNSQQVFGFLEHVEPYADVALFSHGWDQIAYFLNPFEQGEFWHPGLMDLSQQFFNHIGIKIDLRTFVAHSLSSVFSNQLIAKPAYWRSWLQLANLFFDYVEHGESELSAAIRVTTSYGSSLAQTPMKTFIQERFASILLAQGQLKVAAVDLSPYIPVFGRMFIEGVRTRRLLCVCDVLKQEYLLKKDQDLLDMYKKIRTSVPTVKGIPTLV